MCSVYGTLYLDCALNSSSMTLFFPVQGLCLAPWPKALRAVVFRRACDHNRSAFIQRSQARFCCCALREMKRHREAIFVVRSETERERQKQSFGTTRHAWCSHRMSSLEDLNAKYWATRSFCKAVLCFCLPTCQSANASNLSTFDDQELEGRAVCKVPHGYAKKFSQLATQVAESSSCLCQKSRVMSLI